MSRTASIEKVEKAQLRTEVTPFNVGDTISIHTRIVEGDKERTQIFTGTVIARKGTGLSETFSVHRIAYGEGMERVFLLHSPRIVKIEVVKRGRVRRSKLYHIRGATGKAAKIRGYHGPRAETKGTKANGMGNVDASARALDLEAAAKETVASE